ncbi:MAG: hypothetical protein Q8K75_00870 [Chlamydiales bacterium]|nr:hypothetical protein [Chlamydiales bacterium]
MDGLFTSAYNVAIGAFSIGAGEAVGRHNKLPAGTGALVGIVNVSLHYAVQPAWTAIQLSTRLNPVATVLLLAFRLFVEAAVSNAVVNRFFNRQVNFYNEGLVVGASSNLATYVSKFLLDAALKALRA